MSGRRTRRRLRAVLAWLLGPLGAAGAALYAGELYSARERDELHRATAQLAPAELQALEVAPALVVANATWAFGPWAQVEAMEKLALDRLPDDAGPQRARYLMRIGIVDMKPEGQAAVFNAACAADPSICNAMKDAGSRELTTRFVPPRFLPLSLVGGHPPVPGVYP